LNGVLRTGLVASVAALCIPLSLAQTAPNTATRVANQAKLKQATANFVENKGQWDKRGKFLSRTSGMSLWVTQTGVMLDYYRREGEGRRGNVLDMRFMGANEHAQVQGVHETSFIAQYLKPNQPVRNAHSFKDVKITDLYPGVDLLLYRDQGAPRYDLIVAPGADTNKITCRLRAPSTCR